MDPKLTSTAITNVPLVTVIIPARNEETTLERCLRSLVRQKGTAFEIIVVDDGSTDRTREIAESFQRVKECPGINTADLQHVVVVESRTPLPEGWSGKVNALVTGAALARGNWLLFTDADTEHFEGSLTASLKEAEESGAALLSYSPEQQLTGIAQHLVMPLIFGELAATYRPRDVSDAASPQAAANGQYILVRREVYRQVGGYEAVAGDLLDDVALARNVKRAGYPLRFRLGRGIVRAYMYRNSAEMEEGWTKNLALLFRNPERLASQRFFEFIALCLLPLLAVADFSFGVHGPGMAAAVAAVLMWARYMARVSRAHFGLAKTLVAFLGLPSFALLLRRSARAHAAKRIVWKGRTYNPVQPAASTQARAVHSK